MTTDWFGLRSYELRFCQNVILSATAVGVPTVLWIVEKYSILCVIVINCCPAGTQLVIGLILTVRQTRMLFRDCNAVQIVSRFSSNLKAFISLGRQISVTPVGAMTSEALISNHRYVRTPVS